MKLAHLFIVIALALSVISAQALPVFTDGPPSSLAGTNANYSFTFTATGATPITFAVTAGALPTGLTLSSAGVISGIPNAADAGTTYTGTVTATDTNGLMTTQAFSIAVSTTLLNTVPEGLVNISLPTATTTYLSLPFTADPVYRGTVSASIAPTSNTIAVDVTASNPAPWTAGALANLYFVKFISGNEMGRVMLITANGASTLTLDTTDNKNGATVPLTTSGFSVSEGDEFEVFPADTLSSLFGEYTTAIATTVTSGSMAVTLSAANSAIQIGATVTGAGISTNPVTTVTTISGTTLTLSQNATTSGSGVTLSFSGAPQVFLQGGTSVASAVNPADVVGLYNPTFSKFQQYFFYTTPGSTTGYWTLEGTIPTAASNANNMIIYPYGALWVLRQGTPLTLSLMGRVAEVPVLTKAGTGVSVYGSSGYAVPRTLSQLNLSNWQTGTSIASATNPADVLSLYNSGFSKFVNYFQLPNLNWQTTSGTLSNSVTVNPGDVIQFLNQNSASGATSFLSPAMPYTIDAYTNF